MSDKSSMTTQSDPACAEVINVSSSSDSSIEVVVLQEEENSPTAAAVVEVSEDEDVQVCKMPTLTSIVKTRPGRPAACLASADSPKKKKCEICKKHVKKNLMGFHLDLHMRRPRSTCLECGLNFYTQDFNSHRCDEIEVITID